MIRVKGQLYELALFYPYKSKRVPKKLQPLLRPHYKPFISTAAAIQGATALIPTLMKIPQWRKNPSLFPTTCDYCLITLKKKKKSQYLTRNSCNHVVRIQILLHLKFLVCVSIKKLLLQAIIETKQVQTKLFSIGIHHFNKK